MREEHRQHTVAREAALGNSFHTVAARRPYQPIRTEDDFGEPRMTSTARILSLMKICGSAWQC